MAEQIRQMRDIFLHLVIRACKQMSQVMREDPALFHSRLSTQALHLMQDVTSVHRPAASGHKDASCENPPLHGIVKKTCTQCGRKQAEQIERLGLLWIDVADEKKTA